MSNHTIIMKHDCSVEDNIDNHVVFTHIDQWEKHSIEIIKSIAEQTRNDLRQIYMENCRTLAHLVGQISEQMNKSTLELDDLRRKERLLRRLQNELADLQSDIHLIHDKSTQPIYMIQLSQKSKRYFTQESPRIDSLALDVQKQVLGEKLFGFVQQIEPKLAAKLTGMFLEFDIEHILLLIRSPDDLLIKVISYS